MFKNKKGREEPTIVSLEEMFQDTSVEITDHVKKRSASKVFKGLAGLFALSVVSGVLVSVYPIMGASAVAQITEPAAEFWKSLPSEIDELSIAQRNTLYDKNGDVFAQIWAEDRIALDSLDKISEHAKNGLIATEDKRFYEHGGIDIIGTGRAALSGSGGGSGITKQLVKNLQFYNQAGKDNKAAAIETSYNRKLKELKLSLEYEQNYTKDEILLRYFNTVAFGSANTYSIEAAAQYFFGKSAKELDLAESAALVGSANNPVKFEIGEADNSKEWKHRQSVVLERMKSEGFITEKEAKAAKAQKLKIVKKKSSGNCLSSDYPFYCDYVVSELKNSPKFGETAEERAAVFAKGGFQIKTHLDPAVLEATDKRLERDFGNFNRVVTPVAVVKPGTGGVEAIAVNREYGVGKGETTINVADNPAATGSTYKMVTLAAALNNGFNENNLSFSSQCPYAPAGYDFPNSGFKNSISCEFQGGHMNYKTATAHSSNTWFLTLATKIGMDKVFDMSRQLNLSVPDSLNNRSLSYVLGSVENSSIDMAAAYATFANEGVFCPATPIASYSYADGSQPAIPDTYNPEDDSCRRVMSPYSAGVVLKAMRANTYAGEVPGAFGAHAQIKGYDAVGKSGTNQRYSYSQGHVSKNHALFVNIYDMDRLTRGVYGNTLYKGSYPNGNMAAQVSSDLTRSIIGATKEGNKSLRYNSNDRTLTPVVIEKRDYFSVPSVIGMKPAEALSTMRALGIPTHVSKETIKSSKAFPSGVVAEQSVKPGTELPIGTKKEIVLSVSR
jgi:membrane peptidoglycan carboxypeptidase